MLKKILFSVLLQMVVIECMIAQSYSVSGKVYSSTDGGRTQIPISNVRVYTDTTVTYVAETVTDDMGNFVFTNVPAGTLITIYAEKSGYIFSPNSFERMVNSNISDLNFVGTATGGGTTAVAVTFYYQSSGSIPTNVFLAGSMNGYNPSNNDYKLTHIGNGLFKITVDLEPNDYVYKYVVDGNWVTDPYNNVTDGSQYNNSQITVSDPMITYLLPAFNESYSSSNLPQIKAVVATQSGSITLSNYSLKINSIAVSGTPTLSEGNKVLTYTPQASELRDGNNDFELTFSLGGKTVSKIERFQYSSGSGGGGFSISGRVSSETNNPISGVEIKDGRSGKALAITDASGNYTITGITSPFIGLSPYKDGYSFIPPDIFLDMDKNYTDINFTGSVGGGGGGEIQKIPYTISGKVTACQYPVEGAEIESRGKKVYSGADGSYSIVDTVEYNGTFYSPMPIRVKITSEKVNFYNNQQDIYFTGNNNINVDFSGVYSTDTIIGKVMHPDGKAFADLELKYEIFEVSLIDRTTTLLYDSTIITNNSGMYNAPFNYFYAQNDRMEYYYKITPMLKGYDFNTITVRTDQSCASLKNQNITATFKSIPVCMVSVSQSGKNIVVWERPETNVITGFNVYKEGNIANQYDLVGTVSYQQTAIFIDTISEPSQKAYRYKLGTVTSWGYETALSSEHKTIHLTINKGVGNAWNLIWSHYEGLPISTYKLYRGTNKENMTFLTDIAGNLNSYTDNAAPAGEVYYQIEMVLENACNPEAKKQLKSANVENNYSSTRSNIVSSLSVGIGNIETEQLMLYPNPAENKIWLTINTGEKSYEIYSIQGTLIKRGLVKESIDVSDLRSGLYYIRINSNNQWTSHKFVKK